MFKAPSHCPTCQGTLTVRELSCQVCGTTVRGTWSASPFDRLSSDEQAFLILFVRSRGNLSEVERALGVSYPTVRAKLEEVIQTLADETPDERPAMPDIAPSRRAILDRVARGELSATEALDELRSTTSTENDDD